MGKLKKYRIYDYAYHRDIVLVVGNDEQIQKWMIKIKNLDDPWEPGRSSGRYMFCHDSKERFVVITTRGGNNLRDWRLGILSHELFHLACDALREVGLKLTDDSEEAYAYYVQGLFTQMAKYL